MHACRIILRQRSFLPWTMSQGRAIFARKSQGVVWALSLRHPSNGDHEEVAPYSIFNNSLDGGGPVDARWPPRWTRIKYDRIKSEATRKHYVPAGSTKSRLSSSGFRRRSPISHINDAINANAYVGGSRLFVSALDKRAVIAAVVLWPTQRYERRLMVAGWMSNSLICFGNEYHFVSPINSLDIKPNPIIWNSILFWIFIINI